MQVLIIILFYLGVVTGPATYYQSEFDEMVDANKPSIEAVQNDPAQMQIIDTLTTPEIIIMEDGSEEL